jgi:hypothetical protein
MAEWHVAKRGMAARFHAALMTASLMTVPIWLISGFIKAVNS